MEDRELAIGCYNRALTDKALNGIAVAEVYRTDEQVRDGFLDLFGALPDIYPDSYLAPRFACTLVEVIKEHWNVFTPLPPVDGMNAAFRVVARRHGYQI